MKLFNVDSVSKKKISDYSSSYVDVNAAVEELYSSVDWKHLFNKGFHKEGDYCFIFSYPPVRTLNHLDADDIFIQRTVQPVHSCINLYLHIPYCTAICSYCYFAKVVDSPNSAVSKDEYVDLLIWEISAKLLN
jgi:oxygen-independent coproporphyrinogen III oxidase